MRNRNILVLGYFGLSIHQLDGQTVKTRDIYSLLKSKEGKFFSDVRYFDTQIFQDSKLNILKAFRALSKSDTLYYLPAHNNLKYIFPFIFVLGILFNVKIHYIVVGGWLNNFLKNKPLLTWMLIRVKGIYPETKDLSDNLKTNYGFNNVFQLSNFRLNDFKAEEKVDIHNYQRLVFMARVHPLKGVRTIFKLEEELIKQNIHNVQIDIYGPLFTEFEKEFKTLIEESQIVRYKGVLQPNEIYETLVNYDLMLFPTQYFTEGFPGSILDAYIAEVPLVATNWKYADEFIVHNESGLITEFGNEDLFIKETISLLKDKNRMSKLQEGVKKQKYKYSPEQAWEILKNNL